jgi:hypothetical protein
MDTFTLMFILVCAVIVLSGIVMTIRHYRQQKRLSVRFEKAMRSTELDLASALIQQRRRSNHDHH